MKSSLIPSRSEASESAAPGSRAERQGRRRAVVGAGVAAGAAVALAALPGRREPAAQVADTASRREPAEGYRLTEHVRRYYETTRT